MLKTICFFFLMIRMTGLLWSQQRAPIILSPEVHQDNSITFRYYSRTANKVLLSGEFLKASMELAKDTSGVWSITVPSVVPDIYPYSFIVDNVPVADPNHTYIFANERFKRSIVEVNGNSPLVHSLQQVPHGKISYTYYPSKSIGRIRPLVVYTPPGYDGKRKYPVLYLIHGGSDTEETWTKVGKAHLIADNLIAQGKATPMIIVMPYGNVRPSPMADFTKEFTSDIIPFVETHFKTKSGSKHRAIAGFSVGGGQTLNIGFSNPTVFSYICSYAPYTATEEFKKIFDHWTPNAEEINKHLKLFTISVGSDDFLYESVKSTIALFNEKKIINKPLITDGGHTWMNCKKYLANTLMELFK